jgi:SsrA-binding protein
MSAKKSKSKVNTKRDSSEPVPFFKTIATNRRARYDYEILEQYEAGIMLSGTEIKAIREGRVNIGQSFARFIDSELWLLNAHIAEYSAGNLANHEPTRNRKLLLKAKQISKIRQEVKSTGLTLIPLRLYLKGHLAKIEIALCRGKRQYDKRQTMIRRTQDREIEASMNHRG